MDRLTPAQRSLRSRMGAFAVQARYGNVAINERARAVYRDSFRSGHGCAVCPRIDIPAGLPEAEVDRRVIALRKLHFARLALASARNRKRKAAGAVEAPTAAELEVRLGRATPAA